MRLSRLSGSFQTSTFRILRSTSATACAAANASCLRWVSCTMPLSSLECWIAEAGCRRLGQPLGETLRRACWRLETLGPSLAVPRGPSATAPRLFPTRADRPGGSSFARCCWRFAAATRVEQALVQATPFRSSLSARVPIAGVCGMEVMD